MLPGRTDSSRYTIAAWVLTGIALLLVLQLRVLPALLAGMLVYELVHVIAPTLNEYISDRRAKIVAVGLLSALVVVLVTLLILGAIVFFRSDAGNLSALLGRMAEIIDGSRTMLPAWIVDEMPDGPEDLKETLSEWFRAHAADVRSLGKEAGRVLVQTVIGMVLGAMIALHEAMPFKTDRPLAHELAERITRLGDAFRRVVFAQVKISLINTLLSGRGRESALQEDADRSDVHRRTPAGRGQPDLERRDRRGKPVDVDQGGCGLAGVPDRDSQARVFSQRAHRRPADRMPGMGASAGDAGDGSGVRHSRPHCRADFLRLPQGRAVGPRAGLRSSGRLISGSLRPLPDARRTQGAASTGSPRA